MIWLWCCFSDIIGKFVSKLSYVCFLCCPLETFTFCKEVGNNLLLDFFLYRNHLLRRLSFLCVEIFLSGNFIFISLKKPRCSKYLRGLRAWAKRWTKNKCVLVSAWQEFLFFSSCNRPLWKFVLRHEFVQCIHVASRRQPPAPHRWAAARNCQWCRPLRPKTSESTDCRKKKREEFDSHV